MRTKSQVKGYSVENAAMQSDEANELKRCRALALEQNQRLLGEAHRRLQQAEQILTHPGAGIGRHERRALSRAYARVHRLNKGLPYTTRLFF